MAVEVRRPWRVMSLALLGAFSVMVIGAFRAEAAVSVSYQVYSENVQVGSHEFYFSASKSRNGANTTLYAYVKMTDGNGTPGTADDVTQTHQFSFTLPADALTVTDNLATVKFNSGPLKLPGGGGRDYGMIQFTGTDLQRVNNVPSDCYSYRYRDATFSGTIKFNSFLSGVGKVNRSSIGGTAYRYAYRSPCPDTEPQECSNFRSLSGSTNDTGAGTNTSVYVSRSPSDRYFSVAFSDPESVTAPARVTHQLSGGYPRTAFRQASTLKTGKFDGGPIKYLDGAVSFLATAPTQSYPNGDCPDYKFRSGDLMGMLMVDFVAGDDYTFTGTTANQTKYTRS